MMIWIFFLCFVNLAQAFVIPNVPYLYQYDNRDGAYNSWGGNTCQVTSIAMAINHYSHKTGGSIRAIQPISLYAQRTLAKSPEGAAKIFKQKLGYGWFTRVGTRAQLRGVLRSGRPVVLNNYFTAGGHVVLVIGFTDKGFVIHDPAGIWAGRKGGGYPKGGSGKSLTYSYASLRGTVIGVDGDMWLAAGDTRPINPGYGVSL
jgi:hypothetical protein